MVTKPVTIKKKSLKTRKSGDILQRNNVQIFGRGIHKYIKMYMRINIPINHKKDILLNQHKCFKAILNEFV